MTHQDFFNRYQFNIRTDKIGGGSFGTVYKAYDDTLDKTVAIKVSEVKIMGGKEFSLKDEFAAIRNLPPHKNIANYESLYTFEMHNGVFDYALMQFYPDGNLSDLIKQNLSFEQKEAVVLGVLNGINHLHHHKIVHRDLKPSNILISKNKNHFTPKITDFGLSKKVNPNDQSRFSNSFGGGTLQYSSPEQLDGKVLRFNTDLWALGVILYEIFTQKKLFELDSNTTNSAKKEKDIYDQIVLSNFYPKLSELPDKWKQLALRCLERNPDKRIKSFAEIKNIIPEIEEHSNKSSSTDSRLKAEEKSTNKIFETFIDESAPDPTPQNQNNPPVNEQNTKQVNTSGLGDRSVVPQEITGWNWGAFFLSWIWGIGNKSYIALLSLIPYVGFIMIFVLGANGNKWAWKNRKWDSIEHFKQVQKKWTQWGVGVFAGSILLIIIAVIIKVAVDNSYSSYEDYNSYEVEETSNDNSSMMTKNVDNLYAIDIPSDFSYISGLNDVASLEYGNEYDEFYIIVIEESISETQDYASLDTYSEYREYVFESTYTSDELIHQTKEKYQYINGFDAYYVEDDVLMDDVKGYVLHAVISGTSHYYQIMIFTLASQKYDKKDIMLEMLNSFKEI